MIATVAFASGLKSLRPMVSKSLRRPALRTYAVIGKGDLGQKNFRLFFNDDSGKIISPWHDIPLRAGPDSFNFICEIPKFGRDKMEVATREEHNPIAQDLTASGDLRQYYGPIYWNYGMLPQTWEDPNHLHPEIKSYGDNDPLDVVEIGSAKLTTGAVVPVWLLHYARSQLIFRVG
jgi:inorganic pyrophosphatase